MATTGGSIRVELIGDDELRRKLKSSKADVPVARFLDRAAFYLQGKARKNAPVGVDGKLKGSIGVTSPSSRSRSIGPSVKYGEPVEKGSKPHLTPPGALDAWAKKKGLDPERVRWSIAKKGTKAQPYLQPAADDTETFAASTLVSVLAAEIESAFS